MLLVKVGGGAAINWEDISKDLVNLLKKKKIIIVHGANAKRDEIALRLGHPTKIITAPSGVQSVYTDKNAIDILTMVYAGLINTQIVARMQSVGINAVGLSGVDGRLWQGKRKKILYEKVGVKTKIVKDTFTGRVEKINTKLIKLLVKNNFVPVICAPAISYQSEIINVDNDWAVAVMAQALKVREMVILFEAPGMLKNYKDAKSITKNIKKDEINKFMDYAEGRMKKKLIGVRHALGHGVKKIYFGDGRVENPISLALSGRGTILS